MLLLQAINIIFPRSSSEWPSTQNVPDGWRVLVTDILTTAQDVLGMDLVTGMSYIYHP
jgi:hypothetical protein